MKFKLKKIFKIPKFFFKMRYLGRSLTKYIQVIYEETSNGRN